MGTISDLLFEGVEGESDAILIECFSPTPEYQRVLSTPSVIILGAKGTGKSAILRKVMSLGEPGSVLDLSPTEYLWRRAGIFSDETGTSRFSAKHAWEVYLLFGIIMHRLSCGFALESVSQVGERLSECGLRREDFGPNGGGPVREHAESLTLQFLRSSKPNSGPLVALLREIARKALLAGPKTTVTIDRLDLFWDGSKLSKRVSEAILMAWKEIPESLPNLSIKLSLRTDTYRQLQFAEHDKIASKIVHLRWDRTSLVALLARRVSFCLHGESSDEPTVLMEAFPEYVTGVRGYAGTQDAISYIFRNIQERPRDLLQFCRLAKEACAPEAALIEPGAIVQAERAYSEQKRISLEKEYAIEIPTLPTVFARLSGARDQISFLTLESRLNSHSARGDYSFRQLATKLVEIGILGYAQQNGEQFYQDDPAFLGAAVSRGTTFVIHRCLRSALRTKAHRQRISPTDIQELHSKMGLVRDDIGRITSGSPGGPIFKATRRTEMALMRPVVARDEAMMRGFVVDMCELIYESAGGKTSRLPELSGPTVEVVSDLNKFRADLTHDLDHGDEKEIRRKARELGRLYRTYLGKTNPSDEQDWLEIQRAIYVAITGYLERVRDAARLATRQQPVERA